MSAVHKQQPKVQREDQTFSKSVFAGYLDLVDPVSEPLYRQVEVQEVHYISPGTDRVNLAYINSQGELKRDTFHLSAFKTAPDRDIYVREDYWQGWMK